MVQVHLGPPVTAQSHQSTSQGSRAMRKLIVLAAAAAVALRLRGRRNDEDVWHKATRPVDLR